MASKVLAVPEGYLDPFRPVFRMNVIRCHEGRKLPRPWSNAMAPGLSSTWVRARARASAIRRRLVRPQSHAGLSAQFPPGKILNARLGAHALAGDLVAQSQNRSTAVAEIQADVRSVLARLTKVPATADRHGRRSLNAGSGMNRGRLDRIRQNRDVAPERYWEIEQAVLGCLSGYCPIVEYMILSRAGNARDDQARPYHFRL